MQVQMPQPVMPATPQISYPQMPSSAVPGMSQPQMPQMPQIPQPQMTVPPATVTASGNWLPYAIIGLVCYLAGFLTAMLFLKH
jgi:hypothetical protein